MQAMTNMVSDTLEALSQQSKEVAENPAGIPAPVAAGQSLTAASSSTLGASSTVRALCLASNCSA